MSLSVSRHSGKITLSQSFAGFLFSNQIADSLLILRDCDKRALEKQGVGILIGTTMKKRRNFVDFLPTCGVYAIINTVTGKAYIGQSINIASRWKGHVHDLEAGSHVNKALQADWEKYGSKTFSIIVIVRCDPEYLLSAEGCCIKEYKSLGGVYNNYHTDPNFK